MKNIEKVTNNMKIVYSILCNLKKCTIFELQKMTKFRDVDLCLALGYLLQNNQIYRLCKLNCVMLYSHSISSVGERPAPRGGTTRPAERKITTI